MIAEYDLVNSFHDPGVHRGVAYEDTMPLGANTGLEDIVYEPVILDDPAFAGLADAMQEIVDNDPQGRFRGRPGDPDCGRRDRPGLSRLVRWETYPDVLDTFCAVAVRAGGPRQDPESVEKRGPDTTSTWTGASTTGSSTSTR